MIFFFLLPLKFAGIDNTVCSHGGLLSYQHSQGARPLGAPGQLRILLIHTGVGRNTRELVDRVRARLCLMPKVVSRILDAMDQISEQCLEALERLRRFEEGGDEEGGVNGDDGGEGGGGQEELFETLEYLIDTNQGLLSSLGVSHPSLEAACSSAAGSGLHAKLTGAGGGGCAFALIRPGNAGSVERVRSELEQSGFRCWEARLGCPGVTFSVQQES